MASRTHGSWRSGKTRGAFWAGRALDEHARLDDCWFSLLAFLAPRSSNPFIDGILVRRHSWPNLRRGVGGVIVGVVVVLVKVPDGFLSELPLQVIRTFPWRRSWVGGVRGAGGAGGNLGPGAWICGLVGVLLPLAIGEVLVRRGSVVVLDGQVVIVPDAGVLFLPSCFTGFRRGSCFRGGRGQLLGDCCGFFGSFHGLLAGGGLLPQVFRVFIVGVFVVIRLTLAVSFRVIFIWIGVL